MRMEFAPSARRSSIKPSPRVKIGKGLLASALTMSLAAPAVAASSPPASVTRTAPPAGQYAPPPAGAEANGSAYDDRAQRYDRNYADQYGAWASRYCVDRRSNTAAGALIGGVLGAVTGSGLAGRGDHAAGAAIGGALGATAGAAVGANTRPAACPPGYVVSASAPIYHYEPAYPPAVVYGPDWYDPWIWADGHWVYRPYRYWYWTHGAYWRPGWRPGPWVYRYHRW